MKTIIVALFMFAGLQAGGMPKSEGQASDPDNKLESPGGSQLINDWITVHLKAIGSSKIPSHNIRQLAYTGVALYESIVAGDKNYRSLTGQLNGYQPPETLTKEGSICWQASANAAMATMLRFFYPQNPEDILRFDSLQIAIRNRLLNEGNNEASVAAGEAYGSQVARAVIEWSRSDGDDRVNAPYTVPKGPGLWEPTPPVFIAPILPYLGDERTMVKGSIDNSMPPPPLPFSTESQSDFYKMNEEVYLVSQQLDDDQRATGLFWDDFPDGKTLTGGGHWVSILKTVMSDLNVSLIEGAHLYAGLFITENDAAIGCFKAKYTYNMIRPVTYIQTIMKHSDWNPLIITPPHPEYPAAHATISMSGATILTKMLGAEVSFTDNTYAYRGFKSHHFNNFTEAGREAGISRLYGGIHYRKSIEAGFTQGETIANNISKKLVFLN
jgi:hypothetical protein